MFQSERNSSGTPIFRPSRFFLAAALLVGAGCAHERQDDQTGREPRISAREIVIGSSAALSGQSSFLGTQTLHGSLALIHERNAQGGIHGRAIKLVSLDDGYDPARAMSNTQQLLVEHDVFALFDFVGTPTSVKVMDLAARAQVPALGFFTGAERLRSPLSPWLFHVRDSYYSEAESAIALFADELGLTRIAVMYQEDAFGQAVLAGLQLAMKKRKLSPIAIDTYARGTLDVERARDTLVKSGAEAVAMVGTYAPLAKYVKLSHDAGHFPWFHTVSFVGSEAFAAELIETQHIAPAEYDRIVVTQVVPSPFADDLPAVREYRALAKKYYPEDKPNYVALEGFLNAKVLMHALEACGPQPDRQKFLAALESTRDLDIGIGRKVSYSSKSHSGLAGTFYSKLTADSTFRLFDRRSARVGSTVRP